MEQLAKLLLWQLVLQQSKLLADNTASLGLISAAEDGAGGFGLLSLGDFVQISELAGFCSARGGNYGFLLLFSFSRGKERDWRNA